MSSLYLANKQIDLFLLTGVLKIRFSYIDIQGLLSMSTVTLAHLITYVILCDK